MAADDWGPWENCIDFAERLARLRCLRTLVHCFYGRDHALNGVLRTAERQTTGGLEAARLALDGLPSRDRRKIEATYASILASDAQEAARQSTRRAS